NGPGHVRWAGRIYGSGLTRALRWRRARVYHGIWGLAPYQSLYEPAPSLLGSLPQMPEWHLGFALLMGLSALSFFWSPLTLLLPLLIGAALLPLAQACLSAAHASFPDAPSRRAARLKRRLLPAALHLVQPLARLRGRLREGLTPWRCRGPSQPAPRSPFARCRQAPGGPPACLASWLCSSGYARSSSSRPPSQRSPGACSVSGTGVCQGRRRSLQPVTHRGPGLPATPRGPVPADPAL